MSNIYLGFFFKKVFGNTMQEGNSCQRALKWEEIRFLVLCLCHFHNQIPSRIWCMSSILCVTCHLRGVKKIQEVWRLHVSHIHRFRVFQALLHRPWRNPKHMLIFDPISIQNILLFLGVNASLQSLTNNNAMEICIAEKLVLHLDTHTLGNIIYMRCLDVLDNRVDV